MRKSNGSLIPMERGAWTTKTEFFLSVLGFAVGLGNVWRFPTLCYQNGGGAFLIPYVVMIFTIGLPIFFVEIAIGQYTSLAPNKVFSNMAPISQGIGYASLLVNLYMALYYNIVIAWSLFYLFGSFSTNLQWASCTNSFNGPACYNGPNSIDCQQGNDTSGYLVYWNQTCYSVNDLCSTMSFVGQNSTHCINPRNGQSLSLFKLVNGTLPSVDYFDEYVLGLEETSWESFGQLRWQIVLCLLLAWVLVAMCVINGVNSIGKAAYFNVIFPYIAMTVILVEGLTLSGSKEGILYYIKPKWSSLTNTSVWADAASQVFFSLGVSCGPLITMSSYNAFNNNSHRDSIIIVLANLLTSLYAGFSVFSVLGFMAKKLQRPVDELARSGLDLAFVTFPAGLALMSLPQVWSAIFYLMLMTLGLETQCASVETILSAILDEWPRLRPNKSRVVIVICSSLFLLGLPLCSPQGLHLFKILDNNVATWSLLVIAFCELGVIAWMYGFRQLMKNIKEMSISIPRFMRYYWIGTWNFVSPVVLLGLLCFTLYSYNPAVLAGDSNAPPWVSIMGWIIASSSALLIPIFGFVAVVRCTTLSDLVKPTEKWGPEPIKKRMSMGCAASTEEGVVHENHEKYTIKAETVQNNHVENHKRTFIELSVTHLPTTSIGPNETRKEATISNGD